MKKYKMLIITGILIGAGVSLFKCSGDNSFDPYNPVLPRSLSQSEIDILSADNTFGFKLFKEIVNSGKDENVFISPLSVAIALGMTYNGAKRSTQEAMRQTLELTNLSLEESNNAHKELMVLLLSLDTKVIFEIANSIWYRTDFDVEQDFIDRNQIYFNAEVSSLDFGSPDAVDIINGWISDKTKGKISEVIDNINPDDVMFLINALYFNGNWEYKFDPQETRDDEFYMPDGNQIKCRMMKQENNFLYLENDDFQAVDLPYGNGYYRMTVFLPSSQKTVEELISIIDAANFDIWTDSFTERKGRLYLPKFKLGYEITLNKVLTTLGMGIAFSGGADFTGINSLGGLFISYVLHKTFIDVHEEGTEASAVTVVAIAMGRSTDEADNHFTMYVDRPFIFVIREVNSGAILFIGKIVEPVLE